MTFGHILVERDGPVTLVTINRPAVMNAIHPACTTELTLAFDDFAADPEQWVAICEASPMAIRASKETLLRAQDMPLSEAFEAQWTFPAMLAMFASDDVREGPRAFAEKRAPAWTGR